MRLLPRRKSTTIVFLVLMFGGVVMYSFHSSLCNYSEDVIYTREYTWLNVGGYLGQFGTFLTRFYGSRESSVTTKRIGGALEESAARNKFQGQKRGFHGTLGTTLDSPLNSSFLPTVAEILNFSSFKKEEKTDVSSQDDRGLTAHIWYSLCVNNFQSLCNHPLFPKAPMKVSFVDRLELWRNESEFVQRVFGFIHPPLSGLYTFYVASDDNSEVWLRNDEGHSEKICYIDARDGTPQYADRNQFDKFPSQKSKLVYLQKGKKYFLEVIHIQGTGDDHLELAWRIPGAKNHSIIDYQSTSKANADSIACSRTHHHHMTRSRIPKQVRPRDIEHESLRDALPYCVYHPSYLYTTGILEDSQILTYVYPWTVYGEVFHMKSYKDTPLEPAEARSIVKDYMAIVEKKYPETYQLNNIIKVEKKFDKIKGSRYFLDLNVTLLRENNLPSIISEYIYKNATTGQLCYPKGLQWSRSASIAIVISVRNQGHWMIHFLDNLEEIHVSTGDNYTKLIVFDFESNDIDMEAELKARQLPPHTIIKQSGMFSRSISMNAAIRTIKDPHTIIFLLDLHLEIPFSIFDDVRKHCIEGRSVYTPVIPRLGCGSSPITPWGYWEHQGFGIIAMYKSDWDRIGGIDEQKYKNKWGGEDWDIIFKVLAGGLEYERLKHFSMFHFKHSRKGMWTGDKDMRHPYSN